jgi:hypothetical protein
MKLIKLTALLGVFFVFLTTSCKKFEKVSLKDAWTPNLAIPLAYTKYGVYNIFARVDSNDLIVSNATTGEISLNYTSVIASIGANEYVGALKFDENLSYDIGDLNLTPQVGFSGQANSFRTEIIDLNTESDQELDHVFFKSGKLNFDFSTQLRQTINVSLTFPDLKIDNVPVTKNVIMTYNGTSPSTENIEVDLAEVKGDFTLNNTTHNKMKVEMQISVSGNGNQNIDGNELFSTNISSENITFHNADGYFGQTSLVDNADSVLLRVFSNVDQEGNFVINNPKVNFIITNSFGLPVDLHLNNLKTIQAFQGGTQFPLVGFPTPVEIESPNTLGQSTTKTITLDNTNTQNLNSIISPTPKYFYYETNAIPNPNGKTGTPNFVDESSQLEIRAEINMPLEGYAYGFFIQDTVDFNLNQDVEKVESLMFRLISDNNFPVNLEVQIIATNENFKPLFNLFDNSTKNLVDGASVDENGKVINPVHKVNDINLTQEKIELLDKVKNLIIRAEASTTGYNPNNPNASSNVKFYDFYSLALQLSMQLQIK